MSLSKEQATYLCDARKDENFYASGVLILGWLSSIEMGIAVDRASSGGEVTGAILIVMAVWCALRRRAIQKEIREFCDIDSMNDALVTPPF